MTTSIVGSLIDFQVEELPKWRKNSTQVPSMGEMLKEIVKFQVKWKECKDSFDYGRVRKAYRQCLLHFIYHINVGEGHGCTTMEAIESCLDMLDVTLTSSQLMRPESEQERKTLNIIQGYKFLLNMVEKPHFSAEIEELHGLLSVSLIQDAHKLILKDLPLPKNYTKPGVFSERERCVEYHGEWYSYQNPQNMEESVQTLLDRYNDLMTHCVKEEKNSELRVSNMFKTCSWLLFELLDLHPFSDGNGRLCRLLCSYALSSMTPFPTPMYNVWSESSKDDYLEALVAARKSETRHPTSVAAMMIECNYFGWKKFFDILEGAVDIDCKVKDVD
ncbi:uncharacterized protein LOC114525749 [Dendronephthya gigantea]|uniref:uncharacterized protein LOC114525749 n=1 Tax=Dendronephthya gigantea TaxID=151771 RepID=UPI00106B7E5C|nr:uncharacterized protein LOC114525749 [Dendronephthya gigantea]